MPRIIYSTIDQMPIYFTMTAPRSRPIMCKWCYQTKNCIGVFDIPMCIEEHLLKHYLTYTFCLDCYDIYNVFKPSEDELILHIHERFLRKVFDNMSVLHMPNCIRSVIMGYLANRPMIFII